MTDSANSALSSFHVMAYKKTELVLRMHSSNRILPLAFDLC